MVNYCWKIEIMHGKLTEFEFERNEENNNQIHNIIGEKWYLLQVTQNLILLKVRKNMRTKYYQK